MIHPLLPNIQRNEKAVRFVLPRSVVLIHEFLDRSPDLFHIPEHASVDGLVIECPVEPFCHAVGLWLLHKGSAGGDAPVPVFVQEVVGQILRPMIHAPGESPGGIPANRAENGRSALADRLQSRMPRPVRAHVPAHACSVLVLHGGKNPGPAIVHGEDPGPVGPPHLVWAVRANPPVIAKRRLCAAAVTRNDEHDTYHGGVSESWRGDRGRRVAGRESPPSPDYLAAGAPG